jgi:nitronate monooxygenase/enoyl-[acyl-carrier protein] reductase II
MLHTRFCDLFDLEVPILQAAAWPATTPQLVAAVSETGALGTLSALFTPADELEERIGEVRRLTGRPFVVNHLVPVLDEDAFAATLAARPAAVSLALGDPGDLVARAHEAGSLVIHQIHTVAQAREAVGRGVDVVIAQGSEAGGQGMLAGVSVMALVPQVADAVAPVPVLAAGAVADGRALAAALVLGAAGANVGTRFLASEEAGIDVAWKGAIVEAESEDAVRFEPWADIMPPDPQSYDVVPRVIRTPFVDEWRGRRDEVPARADELRAQIFAALETGRPHEITPFAGQSAGLVHDVRPAADIVRTMAAGAEEALAGAAAIVY